MSGEKRWRRVGVLRSLEGRRSEEMIQSNAFYLQGLEVPLESQRGRWQLKSFRMKRFLEEGRMEERRSRLCHPLERSK